MDTIKTGRNGWKAVTRKQHRGSDGDCSRYLHWPCMREQGIGVAGITWAGWLARSGKLWEHLVDRLGITRSGKVTVLYDVCLATFSHFMCECDVVFLYPWLKSWWRFISFRWQSIICWVIAMQGKVMLYLSSTEVITSQSASHNGTKCIRLLKAQ